MNYWNANRPLLERFAVIKQCAELGYLIVSFIDCGLRHTEGAESIVCKVFQVFLCHLGEGLIGQQPFIDHRVLIVCACMQVCDTLPYTILASFLGLAQGQHNRFQLTHSSLAEQLDGAIGSADNH